MQVLIFANGDLQPGEWLQPILERATVIIAADGGARHVVGLSRFPDVVIGDFDSITEDVRQHLGRHEIEIVQAPAAKDETDLELALLYAIEHYDLPITVLAGLGGRLDQMFANLLLLMHPRLMGRDISFMTEHQRTWIIEQACAISGSPGDKVSLIPLGGDVYVKSTSGLRWPLENERLLFGPARGVSNEMTGDVAYVSIAQGHLLCVHTEQEWTR